MTPAFRRILPVATLFLAACGGGETIDPPAPAPEPPPVQPGVPIPPGQIEAAIGQLDALAEDIMARSGIPGMAVAVVHEGEVAYARGFGVRHEGEPGSVDPDTVFQIASLSKPVGATVLARQVSRQWVNWDTRMTQIEPGFALADPLVTQDVTLGDLYAHRSGLPGHAGDDLEDIGFDRATIIERLRLLPLQPFRVTYDYTNFGLTAAADAVARYRGTDWATLSQSELYQPLGMTRTSSRFADYMARDNRAWPHVWVDGQYQSLYQRDPDAQSPAGGVSSSVNDLAKWLRLVLAEGEWQGQPLIEQSALLPAITPQMLMGHPDRPDARVSSYGFGFNVGVQPSGRTMISHSGAFLLGAATAFSALPSANIGIITLTNAQPRGAPEALNAMFMDLVQYGQSERDWYTAFNALFEQTVMAPEGRLAGKTPPANPTPSAPWADYVGTYGNAYFGELNIVAHEGLLHLQVGPKGMRWPLQHWDGNIYVYTPTGENAPEGSRSAVTFERNGGAASAVNVEFLDRRGQGTFNR